MLKNDEISIESTSRNSATTNPIILRVSDTVRTSFIPKLVNNGKAPEKSVEGKLVYEKKGKKDSDFPTEAIARKDVLVGNRMEIALNSTETYNLFQGLSDRYAVFPESGIPSGVAKFSRVNDDEVTILKNLAESPNLTNLLAQSDSLSLVNQILEFITNTNSFDSLKESIANLGDANARRLKTALNIEALRQLNRAMRDNLNNSSEEFWQNLLKTHSWILPQLFASPCTIFEDKAYVGGKGISNTGGNFVDFIYKNKLTNNVALVEIKTPQSSLIGSAYRDTYSISPELSGAISQVLNYRDKLLKNYLNLVDNPDRQFQAFSPKCYVIAGKVSGLEVKQVSAFENIRGCLSGIEIVAFDELLERIANLLSLFADEEQEDIETTETRYYEDEDIPF